MLIQYPKKTTYVFLHFWRDRGIGPRSWQCFEVTEWNQKMMFDTITGICWSTHYKTRNCNSCLAGWLAVITPISSYLSSLWLRLSPPFPHSVRLSGSIHTSTTPTVTPCQTQPGPGHSSTGTDSNNIYLQQSAIISLLINPELENFPIT